MDHHPLMRHKRATEPAVVVEGMENVIEKDLGRHKELLAQTIVERDTHRASRAHEVKRRAHYLGLVGGGDYNDESLRAAVKDIDVNVRHLSDKANAAGEKIKHHELIVETLTGQLEDQYSALAVLAKYRGTHGSRN